jgi:hypothetical protein
MTMTTSETVQPHTHRCANCGQEFEATCGHLVYREVVKHGRLIIESRPAKPYEYPTIVPACDKPQCAFRGF